jgi:serine/threonine protein kinase
LNSFIGIIHRNIKPKHLLIHSGPDINNPLYKCTLQLADFALARILDHPPHPYTTEVITLWYRPPEILMGQKNYTAAVDVWSCGCIFAELLQVNNRVTYYTVHTTMLHNTYSIFTILYYAILFYIVNYYILCLLAYK